MPARSILKDLASRPTGQAQEERLRRASPFAAAAAAAADPPAHEPMSAESVDDAAAPPADAPRPRQPVRPARTREGNLGSAGEAGGGETAGRFAGKGPRRTVSAHLPVSLDKRLTRYERQLRREGDRVPRIALVEQAIEALPADLAQLEALLEQHARLLDLDEASRLLTARVAVPVAERLDELVDACYLEANLPKVTKRALVVAALAQLLDGARVPA